MKTLQNRTHSLTSRIVLTSFLLLFLHSLAYSQISWENLFAKAEKQFTKGKYAKALKLLDKKIPSTVNKKYNANSTYLAWISIYKAKVFEAQGQFTAMSASLDKGLEAIQDSKANNLEDYSIGILKIVDVYLVLGQYQTALEILSALKNTYAQRNNADPSILAEIDLRLAKSLIYSEQFSEVQDLTSTSLNQWANLKSANSGRNGALSKYDLAYRNNQYAQALTLPGEFYFLRGDYAQADSAFRVHERVIGQVAAGQSANTQFLLTKAHNLLDWEKFREAENAYEKAQSTVKKYNRYYLEALKGVMQAQIKRKREGSLNKSSATWEKSMKYFPGRQNIYRSNLTYLNAINQLQNKKSKDARNDLQNLLNESPEIIPPYHILRLQLLDGLYQSNVQDYENKEAIQEAEQNLKDALQVVALREGEDAPKYKSYQVKLAGYYLDYLEDFSQARQILDKGVFQPIFQQRSNFHKDFIPSSRIVAQYFDITDEYSKALDLLKAGTTVLIQKFGTENIQVALQMKEQAEMQLKVGEYKEMENIMNTASPIIRKKMGRKSSEYADALALMAKYNGTIGLYNEAEKLLRQSTRIYRKMGITDIRQTARSVEEMAFLYVRIGKFAETELLLEESIQNKKNLYGTSSQRLINPYNQLAYLNLIKGDYSEAESLANQAESLAKKTFGSESLIAAQSYSLLARYQASVGDYIEAEEYLQKVIKIQEKILGKNHIELAQSYNNLALVQVYQDKSNASASLKLLAKAQGIIANNFDERHPLYAEILKNWGYILVETGEYTQAFQRLIRANEIWKEKLGERNINSAQVYSLLGDIYAYLKNFLAAKENYTQAEAIYKKLLSKEHPDYVYTESKLGRMFFVSGDYKEANRILERTTQSYLDYINLYFPSLSEREKTTFWNKIKSDFEFYNSLAVKQSETQSTALEKMYNFQLTTKALLLNSSIKLRRSILQGNDQELKEMFSQWIRKKEELNSLLAQSEEDLVDSEIDPLALKKEITTLEKALSEKSELFAGSIASATYTWKDVKKSLQKDEAAIEIIRYRNFDQGFSNDVRYAALIVTPKTKKAPRLVLIENGNQLEGRYLTYYRNKVRFRQSDKYSYKTYWQPIEEKLEPETKIIYLSPDGAYNQININALRIDDNSYVIDKSDIRLVSNTKDLILQRAKRKKSNSGSKLAILFGNPVFYGSEQAPRDPATFRNADNYVAALPGTEVEINNIQALFKKNNWQTETYTQYAAAESTIKKLKIPRVLHIATHGFFEERSEESDIQLTSELKSNKNDPLRRSGLMAQGAGDLIAKNKSNYDWQEGILTAYEAMNLNLDQTDLVVLSACETGLGEVAIGEGVYGLQRAFLVAGAESLIMSLFQVNDEVTQKLMTSFYQKWLATGNKREAFLLAQKEIKEAYEYPALWGAFNMIGVE